MLVVYGFQYIPKQFNSSSYVHVWRVEDKEREKGGRREGRRQETEGGKKGGREGQREGRWERGKKGGG